VRRLGLALLILAFVLAAPVGVLYVAVPPNESPEDGPADPLLGLRRSVLIPLEALGIIDGPGWFSGWYLPNAGGTQNHGEGPNGEEILLYRMEIEREPVYRGLFWIVGHRIKYRSTEFDDERNHWQVLRLCYTEDGERFVSGEGTLENGMLDPDGSDHSVRGYVPRSADGYWVEGVDQKGDVHSQHGWGHVDEFWRDERDK
jgi:hypothetical protein